MVRVCSGMPEMREQIINHGVRSVMRQFAREIQPEIDTPQTHVLLKSLGRLF